MASEEYWATELAELLPAGTTLAEVDPDFRGMPLARYTALRGEGLMQEALARQARRGSGAIVRRVWTPRDSYGWRSL
jgi:hypothetical protein